MAGQISKLYIFLSEKEAYVQNDVEKLYRKGLFSPEEITRGDSLLICISRDYFDQPNPTPAVMIRDQLSNVFCPKWRINHIKYHALLPIMHYNEEDIPDIYVITENQDIYYNMDYYLHLGKFEGRYKMLLSNSEFEPINSQIRREDVVQQGEMIAEILKSAGYGEDPENGYRLKSVPGWTFQCAGDWTTRLLDIYDVYPNLQEHPDLPYPYPTERQDIINLLNNPILRTEHRAGEDIRFCIIEDADVRRSLYELTESMLELIA